MLRLALAVVLSSCSIAAGAAAVVAPSVTHLERRASDAPVPTGGADCSDLTGYDDGSYEGAFGWVNAVTDGIYVLRVDLPPGPRRLTAVCLCWTRDEFATTTLDYDVVVYGPGADDQPGELIAQLPVQATSVPEFYDEGTALYRYDLGAAGPLLGEGPIYVGAHWVPFDQRSFYLCSDSTPDTPRQPGWGSSDGGKTWSPLEELRPSYRALGVRIGTEVIELVALPATRVVVPLIVLLPLLAWRLRRRRRSE